MAKRKDIEAQIAALQADLDTAEDDEDIEIWVENKDGHRTKLSGKRAESWLKRNGYDVDEVTDGAVVEPKPVPSAKKQPATKGEPKDVDPAHDETDETDAEPASSHKFFRR